MLRRNSCALRAIWRKRNCPFDPSWAPFNIPKGGNLLTPLYKQKKIPFIKVKDFKIGNGYVLINSADLYGDPKTGFGIVKLAGLFVARNKQKFISKTRRKIKWKDQNLVKISNELFCYTIQDVLLKTARRVAAYSKHSNIMIQSYLLQCRNIVDNKRYAVLKLKF